MLQQIALGLNGLLGFMNGAKTMTGVAGLVLGYGTYVAGHFGIEPIAPTGIGKDITDFVIDQFLITGGGTLAAIGLGHKMGKA